MFSRNNLFVASFLLAVLLLVVLAGSALAETTPMHSPQVTQQLRNLKQTAFEMRKEADTLTSMLPSKRYGWESHTYRLDALKSYVNEMGKSLAELESQKPVAGERQTLAIEQTRLHLVPAAQNLSRAIELVNENRDSVIWDDYGAAVRGVYAHATALHSKLGTILDYEDARTRFERLEGESQAPVGE